MMREAAALYGSFFGGICLALVLYWLGCLFLAFTV
jgi:hypothetical protein